MFETADLILSTCLCLLSSSSVILYLPINDAEDNMVLKGVLNSWEAMVTKRDFISFNSFSFSSAILTSSLDASNSCNVSFKIFVLSSTFNSSSAFTLFIFSSANFRSDTSIINAIT